MEPRPSSPRSPVPALKLAPAVSPRPPSPRGGPPGLKKSGPVPSVRPSPRRESPRGGRPPPPSSPASSLACARRQESPRGAASRSQPSPAPRPAPRPPSPRRPHADSFPPPVHEAPPSPRPGRAETLPPPLEEAPPSPRVKGQAKKIRPARAPAETMAPDEAAPLAPEEGLRSPRKTASSPRQHGVTMYEEIVFSASASNSNDNALPAVMCPECDEPNIPGYIFCSACGSARNTVVPLRGSSRPADEEAAAVNVEETPSGLDVSGVTQDVDDMIELESELSEALILRNLELRFKKDAIYTNIGNVLVSMNPYRLLPQLYSEETMRQYSLGDKELGPHVFAVAARSLHHLLNRHQSQTILLTGESGAGKTEAAKWIVSFFSQTVETADASLVAKLSSTNTLLEAFGNAQTTVNANSSRFGKFFKLVFQGSTIVGAEVDCFLLEKSRVVHQAEGERNYHVFYRMLRGMSATQRNQYKLDREASDFALLKTCSELHFNTELNDKADWLQLGAAFETFGINSDAQDELWSILAGILHLGEIDFMQAEAVTEISNPGVALKTAAQLLRINADALRDVLVSGLNVNQAAEVRDAIAMMLYGKVFDTVVSLVNGSFLSDATSPEMTSSPFIGLLDLPGFEALEKNGFEQLIINFGSEKVQQLFVDRVWKGEQETYMQEGIDWDPIAFVDNQSCVELLESVFFPLLDEECRLATGSDANFGHKLMREGGKHPNLKISARNPNGLGVLHYAATVNYTTTGFRRANHEDLLLRPETVALLGGSGWPVCKKLALGKEKAQTLSERYRSRLSSLLSLINSTEQHFVRCIRPNAMQVSAEFRGGDVLSQIRALGLLATCQMRRAGFFPHSFEPQAFIYRYSPLVDDNFSSAVEIADALVAKCDVRGKQEVSRLYAMGNRHVLFSEVLYRAAEKLEQERAAEEREAERMALELQAAQERAAEEERQKEREARARLEAERAALEEECARKREREEEERKKEQEARARLEAERIALEEERARKQEREEEAAKAKAAVDETKRRQIVSEKQRMEEELIKLQLALAAEEVAAEKEREERGTEKKQLKLAGHGSKDSTDDGSTLAELEIMQKRALDEEDRRKRDYQDALQRHEKARGFIRPLPLDQSKEWQIRVVGTDVRKADAKKRKETWIRFSVKCGPEQWEIVKSPADVEEFAHLVKTKSLVSGARTRLIPPLDLKATDDKDVTQSVQSFFQFCSTEREVWTLSEVKDFCRAGLNACQDSGAWLNGCQLSGTLVKKKGEKTGIAKKEASRYCVIKDRILYYFSSRKDSVQSNPKGLITLDGSIVALTRPAGSESPRKHAPSAESPRKNASASQKSFKLIQNDGTHYQFTCGDVAAASRWVDTIKQGNECVRDLALAEGGALQIELIGARDLHGTSGDGSCNPFVIAYVEGQQLDTKPAYNTTNPVWRSTYGEPEPIPVAVVKNQQSLLWITVWNKRHERHEFLGMAALPVSAVASLEDGSFDGYIPLAPRSSKEKVSGAVRVAVTFFKEPSRGDDKKIGGRKNDVFFGKSLRELMQTETKDSRVTIPVFFAQIVAHFVRHKDAVTDKQMFQNPFGPEWKDFLEEFERSVEQTGRLKIREETDDPAHLLGLLLLTLRELREPILGFKAFETLIAGDKGTGVNVAAVEEALRALPGLERAVLGHVMCMLRMLIANSPANLDNTDTVKFGRVVASGGGRAHVRRRMGQGVTAGDVVASFGSALARPPMETEKTVLRLLETNQLLEYVLLNSATLFTEVDLLSLADRVALWKDPICVPKKPDMAAAELEQPKMAEFDSLLLEPAAKPLSRSASGTTVATGESEVNDEDEAPEWLKLKLAAEAEMQLAKKPLPVPESDSDET